MFLPVDVSGVADQAHAVADGGLHGGDRVSGLRPNLPDDEASASPVNAPVLDLILSEEQIEVTTRVVPTERVKIFVDTVSDTAAMNTTVAREVIDLTTQSLAGKNDPGPTQA